MVTIDELQAKVKGVGCILNTADPTCQKLTLWVNEDGTMGPELLFDATDKREVATAATLLAALNKDVVRVEISDHCSNCRFSKGFLQNCFMHWDIQDWSGYAPKFKPDPDKCPGPAPPGHEHIIITRKVVE